jgi:hypothetical protein
MSLAGLFLALISTQDWRPGLLSAVPSGLVPIHLESYLFSAITVQVKLIEKVNLDRFDYQPSPRVLKRQLLGIPRCLLADSKWRVEERPIFRPAGR